MAPISIRPLDPTDAALVELVAQRMRLTLIEVLGETRGTELYEMDWLRERLRWHVDPSSSDSLVLLAHSEDDEVHGHTIVRVEATQEQPPFGLFSTTFVVPERRRDGIAMRLIEVGEEWLQEQGMTRFVTDTSVSNVKLIRLFEQRGYAITLEMDEMVRLSKQS